MTSATWKNFYVSEYDLEMHTQKAPLRWDERGNCILECGCIEAKVLDEGHYCHSENVTDFAERRRHTDLDHALQALDRLKDTIEELRQCTDPHAKESITYSIKAKLRDSEIAIKHLT